MIQFNNLEDLTTKELLELDAFIQELTHEKEHFKLFYEGLSVFNKGIFINTDYYEKRLNDTIIKFLISSEKESLLQLYNLSEKRIDEIKTSLLCIKLDSRFKIYEDEEFKTFLQTLPTKIKQLDLGDINNISKLKLKDLEEQLNNIEVKMAEAGGIKARADLKLQGVPRLSASKKAIATRVRNFTDKVGRNIQSRLKAEILDGIKAGESTSQIANRIRAVYKKPIPIEVKPRYEDGKLIRHGYKYNISNKNWSEMVARSEAAWSTNQGRLEAYKDSGLVKTVQWQTASDPCPECAIMEGEILELYEAEGMIPYHVNCRCTWTVNEYKSVEEKLPEPPSEFSDELYERPDGVGIMGIMKMRPGDQRVLERALELGNYKLAEKLMRHQHLSLGQATINNVEKVNIREITSYDKLRNKAHELVEQVLGTERTLRDGRVIHSKAEFKIITKEEAAKVLKVDRGKTTVGGWYNSNTDTCYLIKAPINTEDEFLLNKERVMSMLSTSVHEIVHSYGNHIGRVDLIEGATVSLTNNIMKKIGAEVSTTSETYLKFRNQFNSILATISEGSYKTGRNYIKQISTLNISEDFIVKKLSEKLKVSRKKILKVLKTEGLAGINKTWGDKLYQNVSEFVNDVVLKSLKDINKIYNLIAGITDSMSKTKLEVILSQVNKLYDNLTADEQEKLNLLIVEMNAKRIELK